MFSWINCSFKKRNHKTTN